MEISVEALSRATKLRDAEVRWVLSQTTALIYSLLLRQFIKPNKNSTTLRHILQLLVGAGIALFCFGWGILHFLIDGTVCYILVMTLDPRYCQLFVTFFSVGYMSAVHLYHMYSNFGVNAVDYIGPLMVVTEKLSSLSWSIHDGFRRKEEELNHLQKKMVVREYPSVLQFYSFIFCPQNLLVGPVTFYAEYLRFIEGEIFMVEEQDERGDKRRVFREPSAAWALTRKLTFALLSGLCLLKLVPLFPIMSNVDEDHIANHSLLYRLGWLWVSIEVAKSKYFLAWVLADAVNNAAGLGFNGYDDDGKPKWDGVTNVRIWEFETATSLKVLIDNWNITGARWLRHVCFDRMPFQRKVATFLLSSIWHGFYPGYFFCFGSASFMVAASQKVRANLRHHFTSSPTLKAGYDALTWFCTHLCLAYFIAPFTFLRFDLCVRYFNSMYWFLHILALLAIIVLPGKKHHKHHRSHLNHHVHHHDTGTAGKMNGTHENNHAGEDALTNHHKPE